MGSQRSCSNCGEKLDYSKKASIVFTRPYPNEGSSEIQIGDKYYNVDHGAYCCLDCLFEEIRRKLK